MTVLRGFRSVLFCSVLCGVSAALTGCGGDDSGTPTTAQAPAQTFPPPAPTSPDAAPTPSTPDESDATPSAPSANTPGPSPARIDENDPTVAWAAPTANVDGTTVDLSGYTIVYGPSATVLHESLRIDNPSIDRYVFDTLPAGTYYFGVKAVSASGVESAVSNIVRKVLR